MASLSLMVLEAQDYWKKNFAGFLADSLLESGERGCLPAFIIDCFLQSHLEIFDRPRESDTKRVGFFRNELDLLSKEVEDVV